MGREDEPGRGPASDPLRREWAEEQIEYATSRSRDVDGVLHKLAVGALPYPDTWRPITVYRQWTRRGVRYAVVIAGLDAQEARWIAEVWEHWYAHGSYARIGPDGSHFKVRVLLRVAFINSLEYKLMENSHERDL